MDCLEAAMPRLAWKIAISVTISAFIISRIDIYAVGRAIAHADAAYFSLVFLLSLVMVVTDALLWKSTLQALGHNISRGPALLYAIVGCFFGSLAPSAMGADLFRAVQLRRLGVPIETTVHAVVVTRLASFASLLLVNRIFFSLHFNVWDGKRIAIAPSSATCVSGPP